MFTYKHNSNICIVTAQREIFPASALMFVTSESERITSKTSGSNAEKDSGQKPFKAGSHMQSSAERALG